MDWREYARELAGKLEKECPLQAEWIRDALIRVPRHLFIEQYYDRSGDDPRAVKVDPQSPTEQQLKAIYADDALLIRQAPVHSSCSQPQIIFLMLDDLRLAPGMKVLEIGVGSGWNTGLLAFGTGDDRLVYSIDIQADLATEAREHLRAAGFAGVNLRAGDGGYGWPEAAPFDRVIVTAAASDIPAQWTEQLAEGGVLLMPFKIGQVSDPVLRLEKRDGRLTGAFTRWSWFYAMRGDFEYVPSCEQGPAADPEVERLMRGEARLVALQPPAGSEFLFFLYLNGIRQTGAAICKDDIGFGVAFLDREAGSVCFVPHRDSIMRVYGSPEMGERLLGKEREWLALGQPTLTDYRVDCVGAGPCELEANEWFDERPCARLKVSLCPR